MQLIKPANDFSVILLKYEQFEILALQLASIANQTFKGRVEVIITDDGSDLSGYSNISALIKLHGLNVKFVWQPDNGYQANRARNSAIRLATGSYLLFIDGDIILGRDTLNQHWREHIAQERNFILTGIRRWREFHPCIQGLSIQEFWQSSGKQLPTNALFKKREKKELAFRQAMSLKYPYRSCIGAHFSVPNTGALFDEALTSWGPDDLEFFCRLHLLEKFGVTFLTGCYVYHVDSETKCSNPFRRMTTSQREIKEYMKSMLYFYDRYRHHDIGDILTFFSRVLYDAEQNIWYISTKENSQPVTEEKIKFIRQWLKDN